jgi:AcrR family transcriptional regulator
MKDFASGPSLPALAWLSQGESLMSGRNSAAASKAYPVRQQRSEETRRKLLLAGFTLLNNGSFDDISIAQIASSAGCSVGSFYQRFRNKDAYFEFLVEGISEALRNVARLQLTTDRVRGLSLAQTVQFCVAHYVDINRQYKGLIRAALLYSMNGTDDWQPIRDNGLMLHNRYIELIVTKLKRSDLDTARTQLLNGLQIVSSHLVNSIAHPVVTLSLDHTDLCQWMTEVVMHSLKVSPPPKAPTHRRK